MPHNNFVIENTESGLFCIGYNEILENCSWGNILNAVRWDTQVLVDAAIAEWGSQPAGKFIGKNPPPH